LRVRRQIAKTKHADWYLGITGTYVSERIIILKLQSVGQCEMDAHANDDWRSTSGVKCGGMEWCRRMRSGDGEEVERRLSVIDTSWCRGYRLEVCSPWLDEVLENGGPVFPGVPGDFARRVDLNGHDLANAGTLDNDY